MSWREVFDTNHGTWGHMGFALRACYDAGYPYMCWNGRIYTRFGADTGLTTEDIV